MRWLLCGLCFALLVALAVATAAIRASNAQARARLALLQRDRSAYHVEFARRAAAWREELGEERLRRRLRALLARAATR